jgi:copper transporter 1
MFGSCLFFFILAILYELLKYSRQVHLNKSECRVCEVVINPENGTDSNSTQESPSYSHSVDDKTRHPLQREEVGTKRSKIKMLSMAHLIQTVLYMLQIFISYLLMLGFMLFNIWICLAVILGAGVGYFCIGTRKVNAYAVYVEDHCHN